MQKTQWKIKIRLVITKDELQELLDEIPELDNIWMVNERYFCQAEEQLYGELAYVLGIERDEVEEYITKHISEKSVVK